MRESRSPSFHGDNAVPNLIARPIDLRSIRSLRYFLPSISSLYSSTTPFGLVLEAVSPPSDYLPDNGEPLSFRSGGFSPPFTLLHACILNSDDSTLSHDNASRSYRTLYYPLRCIQCVICLLNKLEIIGMQLKATSSVDDFSSVYFRRKTSPRMRYYALTLWWMLPILQIRRQ